MNPGRVTCGTVITGRVAGRRVTVGRLVGVIVLPGSRIGREVSGLLFTGGRTVVGRVGLVKWLGLVGKVYGRLVTGWRLGTVRVVPKDRFAVGLDVGRRLLVLSACVKPGWQVMVATKLRVSRCLVARLMVLLLVSVRVEIEFGDSSLPTMQTSGSVRNRHSGTSFSQKTQEI